MTNPFAAFTVVTGKIDPAGDAVRASVIRPDAASAVKASVYRSDAVGKEGTKGFFTDLDQLPKDWWKVVENERGGYQYRTVTKVIDTLVETMLDGCAGSNHVTEELVVSMLNRAATLGIRPDDPRFPVVQFEKWVYPEYVHGIASGSPVPLKGAVVLRVRFQEGTEVSRCKDGPEIFLRCKIAAKGTSDWHGLILGGRALDCESRKGLGFRPGPTSHLLDTLGIQMPRCEDLSATRKDRAYMFKSVLSSMDIGLQEASEPGTGSRNLLVYDGNEPAHLLPGEGALVPVRTAASATSDVSLCEAVLPVDGGKVEVVPGVWPTGSHEGMVLVTPQHEEVSLEPGDVVGEIRPGSVASAVCQCGSVDTILQSTPGDQASRCEDCGIEEVDWSQTACHACGQKDVSVKQPLQGCRTCTRKGPSKRSFGRKAAGYGLLATLIGIAVESLGSSLYAFHDRVSEFGPTGWSSFPGGLVMAHWEPREELFTPDKSFPGQVHDLSGRRTTCAKFLSGETEVLHDSWYESDPWVFKGRPWVGETRFYWADGGSGSARWRSTVTNPILHIVETPGGIERMAEETPTDYYYDSLRAALEKKYPKADKFLLDHLVSVEGFLDKSIVFGFSYGVAKAEMCRAGGKLLGHLIGRDGSSPDPERAKAVQDFAPLKEKLHIQQFLGCANWLRTYLPAEFGCAAKVLTGYQKPDAVFPPEGLGLGDTEGCRAVRAIKKMLENAIGLSVFDEASAISGTCPLEQIADASGYAVGGTVLQMSRDLTRFKVLLTHSKSLTPPQQAWAPLIQEAFAQLEVKRATRKTFGSIKTICWTDHANLTKAQHIDVGADVKLVRWVAEILSDGSEIRSLSGRSAKLGDGFSRNPKERDELLRLRTKDLAGLAGHLKEFNLEEYLGGSTEDPEVPVVWGIGNDAVPDSRGGDPSSDHRAESIGAVGSSVGVPERLRVLFVGDYARHSDNALWMSKVQALLSRSMPGWDVSIHSAFGAFEDDDGHFSHLDGPTARLKGDRQLKRTRVDLLTSCAKVLRVMGSYLPDFAIGIGQGGLILGMLRFPLVVEVTLQARNLQRKEIQEVVAGWARLRAVWSINPRMWKTEPHSDLLKRACPEVTRPFPVEPVKGYGVITRGPREDDIRQVAVVLNLGVLKDIADVQLMSLAREPTREVWEHSGKCSCGKRAYVFGRCVSCVEKEAQDDLRASVQAREEEEEKGDESAELVVEDLLAFGVVPDSPDEPRVCFVDKQLVVQCKAGLQTGHRKGLPSSLADLDKSRSGCGKREKLGSLLRGAQVKNANMELPGV